MKRHIRSIHPVRKCIPAGMFDILFAGIRWGRWCHAQPPTTPLRCLRHRHPSLYPPPFPCLPSIPWLPNLSVREKPRDSLTASRAPPCNVPIPQPLSSIWVLPESENIMRRSLSPPGRAEPLPISPSTWTFPPVCVEAGTGRRSGQAESLRGHSNPHTRCSIRLAGPESGEGFDTIRKSGGSLVETDFDAPQNARDHLAWARVTGAILDRLIAEFSWGGDGLGTPSDRHHSLWVGTRRLWSWRRFPPPGANRTHPSNGRIPEYSFPPGWAIRGPSPRSDSSARNPPSGSFLGSARRSLRERNQPLSADRRRDPPALGIS